MNIFWCKLKSLAKRLIIVLIIFILMRNLMLIFNQSLFNTVSVKELFLINFYGLRFDLSAILVTNSIVILLSLLPFKFTYSAVYNKIVTTIFVLINSINIIANSCDIIYYRFTLRRTTSEFISMFQEDKGMLGLIPTFLIDFWYITLITIFLIVILIAGARRSKFYIKSNIKRKGYCISWKSGIVTIGVLCCTVLGVRGGFQLRPLSIIDATKYTDSDKIALVLNTPFTIFRTIRKTPISEKKYFTESELNKLINPIHNYSDSIPFRPLNVVVIIMESMSKEYSASLNPSLNGKGFTPFLDSLMKKALVCNYAYANARKSIDGIPAVLASFPTLFSDAFISSNYSSDYINSLASLLGKKGYSTAFYHGGNNGTMGFDGFAKSIGYEKYYGRTEYNNDKDYDGKWGIFDGKFMPFFAKSLNKTKEPFFASIFSLSAHHPYTLPEEFKNKFPKGKVPILECIAYSDYCLGQFFKSVENEPWYKNTLFVITADHTSIIADNDFNTPSGVYSIPIIYFMPSDSLVGEFNSTTQQIDILPSILDYINYDKPFYSLGNSVFSPSLYREAVSYNGAEYQYISNGVVLTMKSDSEINPNIKQRFISNKLIIRPISNETSLIDMQNRFKALIQEYSSDLIHDKMHVKN